MAQAIPVKQINNLSIEQLVFDDLKALVPVPQADSIEESFAAFHKANPHVYASLRKIALYYRRLGLTHYSMKAIYERLRFAVIETTGDQYKLNNNYTSLYARKLMESEPELEGFFELRERISERDVN